MAQLAQRGTSFYGIHPESPWLQLLLCEEGEPDPGSIRVLSARRAWLSRGGTIM